MVGEIGKLREGEILEALRAEHSKNECSAMFNRVESSSRIKPERWSLHLVIQTSWAIFRNAVSMKRWAGGRCQMAMF